jgi:pilus assembly protein CpaC
VSPEVSELTDVGGVTISGFSVPALLSRKFETTLELNSGQTFVMAGLIKQNVEAIKSQIPGIGDLPILGPLFSSIRYTRNETELAVFVTASLVEPMSLDRISPLPGFLHAEPNDWEVYLETEIESKRPATISPADAERLKQMGLDNLVGPGAWEPGNL